MDYSTKGGHALYEEGGVTLKSSFDLKAGHLIVFLQELTDHAKEMRWSEGTQNFTNFEIHKYGLIKTYNLLTQLGQIPIDNLKVTCEKCGENGAANKTRGPQNNAMVVNASRTYLPKLLPFASALI